MIFVMSKQKKSVSDFATLKDIISALNQCVTLDL